MYRKNIAIAALLILALSPLLSCTKNLRYATRTVPRGAGVAIIIDAKNKVKNVVLARFMASGYTVKAINASDFYSMNEVFDIRDFKKMSYIGQDNFLSLEKTFNNLYKMHFYNFEVNKAEILADMKNKWNVQYLIILSIKDWQGTSWGRAIDLRTNEIIWIENKRTGLADNIEKIVNHFIKSMGGR
jgi:hypothetical protein